MTITPDTMNPTASGTTMKSGYGINEVVTARVSSSQRSATTALLATAGSCLNQLILLSLGIPDKRI